LIDLAIVALETICTGACVTVWGLRVCAARRSIYAVQTGTRVALVYVDLAVRTAVAWVAITPVTEEQVHTNAVNCCGTQLVAWRRCTLIDFSAITSLVNRFITVYTVAPVLARTSHQASCCLQQSTTAMCDVFVAVIFVNFTWVDRIFTVDTYPTRSALASVVALEVGTDCCRVSVRAGI
jgi:hypothetical protein